MQGGDSDIFSAKRQKWHLFFVYFHDKKRQKMADSPIGLSAGAVILFLFHRVIHGNAVFCYGVHVFLDYAAVVRVLLIGV